MPHLASDRVLLQAVLQFNAAHDPFAFADFPFENQTQFPVGDQVITYLDRWAESLRQVVENHRSVGIFHNDLYDEKGRYKPNLDRPSVSTNLHQFGA